MKKSVAGGELEKWANFLFYSPTGQAAKFNHLNSCECYSVYTKEK